MPKSLRRALGSVLAIVAVATTTLVAPPARADAPYIVVVGDSITSFTFTPGGPGTFGGWPAAMSSLVYPRANVENASRGGMGAAVVVRGQTPLISLFPSMLDARPQATTFLLAVGHNDLAHTTDEVIVNAIVSMINMGKARGKTVLVSTLLPTARWYGYYPQTEAQRRRINAWLRAYVPEHVFDLDGLLDPQQTGSGDPSMYYRDGLHLLREGVLRVGAAASSTSVGRGVVPGVVRASLDGLSVVGQALDVNGWILDERARWFQAPVRVVVDGQTAGPPLGASSRPDVDRYVMAGAGAWHGFSGRVWLSPGGHQVCVVGRDTAGFDVPIGDCRWVTVVPDPVPPPCSRIADWTAFPPVGDPSALRWRMSLGCPGDVFPTAFQTEAGTPVLPPAVASGADTVSIVEVNAAVDPSRTMPSLTYTAGGRGFWARIDITGAAGHGQYATFVESWNAPGYARWVNGQRVA